MSKLEYLIKNHSFYLTLYKPQYNTLTIKKALKNLTDDNDNWEDLADDFESELKEVFEDVAYEEYKNRG